MSDYIKQGLDALIGTNGDEPGGDEILPWTPIIDWHELYTNSQERQWLVQDLWPGDGGSIAVHAPAKQGKSLLMLYVAACISMGRDPFTHQQQEPVLTHYLDFEMSPGDILERCQDMGFMPADLQNHRYHLYPGFGSFDTKAGGERLLRCLDYHGSKAVVIDTFSRVVDGEESRNDAIQNYYKFTGVRLKAAKISVSRLDHEGHAGKKARGASGKVDDVDVDWHVEMAAGGFKLTQMATRITGVPSEINLAQTDNPLAFRTGPRMWTKQALDLAKALDALNAPVELGRDKARALLVANDIAPGKNAYLAEAIRYRKQDVNGIL